MSNLPNELREWAKWLESRSFAGFDGTKARAAADVIERLQSFISHRVHDSILRSKKAGYHARRLYLEAEALLKEIGDDD